MTEHFKFLQSHPPRCLDGYTAIPYDGKGIEIDGHGAEYNTFYQLQCQCGGKTHSVLGYYWEEPESSSVCFIGPIATKCTTCEVVNELFDIKIHGYDSELGYGCFNERGKGAKSRFESSEFTATSFELIARFEYMSGIYDDDFTEAKGQEKELFTWFSLHGESHVSGEYHEICSYECA